MHRLGQPIALVDDLVLPRQPKRRLGEAAFLRWWREDPELHRAEWVDGEVITVPPAGTQHNDIAALLHLVLRLFCEAHDRGKVYSDVYTRLSLPKAQFRAPDVIFVSKARLKLTRKEYFDGPPDIAFEVVSARSAARDWHDKLQTYASAGVREYWVIDPSSQRVAAYVLRGGRYVQTRPQRDGRINSRVVRGFFIRPEWFLAAKLPEATVILRQLGL
ncbi:MAG TPA: Uma2 family endonuclease [Tepidisphaeraceae bacterium]|jgi:Uma2 family endonuclease